MIWVLLIFAAWLAATVSGAAGFGGALLLLPAITYAVGAKAAVPVLTLVQLLGNLSRAGFGVFLLLIVAFRHTRFGKQPVSAPLLVPAGAVVGLLSAVAGSAGPLGAAVFLSLGLAPTGYIASEAVTAVFMHVTKTAVYGRYSLINGKALLLGLALGGAMVLVSWSGRKLIQSLPERKFSTFVEGLLVVSAILLIVT